MATVTINRGEYTSIPFTITDANNGLVGKRVTFSIAQLVGGARILRKVSGLPGSSADVTITTQVAGSIVGTINLTVADYVLLAKASYATTLWIDTNTNDDRVCSIDTLAITADVARLP